MVDPLGLTNHLFSELNEVLLKIIKAIFFWWR